MSSKNEELYSLNPSNVKNELREDRKLAELIKDTHAKLREQVQSIETGSQTVKCDQEDNIWNEHADIRMSENLNKCAKGGESIQVCYSQAMNKLAERHWNDNIESRKNEIEKSCRIGWLKKHIDKYRKGDQQKFLQRLLKRKYFDTLEKSGEPLSKCSKVDLSITNPNNESYDILDVGSCYNPLLDQFKDEDVNVTAIDLCPSTESVLKCDFLRVPINEMDQTSVIATTQNDTNSVVCLKENGFDVVIFCLLLEYLPSPRLRYKACLRAKQLLKTNGLLLLVTPDSSRNHAKNELQMKSWRLAFANMGMLRIYIENQKHLRFLGFVKVDLNIFGNICSEEAEKIKSKMSQNICVSEERHASNWQHSFESESLIFIPQDKTTKEVLSKRLQMFDSLSNKSTSKVEDKI